MAMILNGPYIVSQSRKTSPPRIRSNAQPGEVGLLLLFVDILANFDLTSSPGPPSKAAGWGFNASSAIGIAPARVEEKFVSLDAA
jgi:hypothetical protein